jgi:tyrosine-protein kinase
MSVEPYDRMTPPVEPAEDEPLELARYGRALRRNWLLIALIVLPLTALVLVFSLMIGKTYKATARIVLSDSTGAFPAGDVETVKRQLATFQVLVTTRSVLARTAERLRGQSVATLERNVSASVDQNANIINVSATNREASAAAATANAVAQAYLDLRQESAEHQLARDRANLVQTMERLRSSPGGAAQARAIQDRLSQIGIEEANVGSDLQLAQAARPPGKPFSPRPIRNAVFAFFAACFLAVLAALARERSVRRLDGPRELSRLMRLPILSNVPSVRGARGRRRTHVRGAELEAYEAVRASLEFQLGATKHHTVMVTSAYPGEGASEVTAHLGEALAAANRPTLLVDADPRNASLHEFFSLPSGPGFPGLLRAARTAGTGDVSRAVDEALAESRITEQLSVLAHGDRAERPSRLLAGDGLEAMAVFDELSRRNFDYLLIDGPPLLGVVEAQIMAQLVDAVLLVARLDRLSVDDVHDLREVLERNEIKALGLVVVGGEGPVPYYLGNRDRDPVLEDASAR